MKENVNATWNRGEKPVKLKFQFTPIHGVNKVQRLKVCAKANKHVDM